MALNPSISGGPATYPRGSGRSYDVRWPQFNAYLSTNTVVNLGGVGCLNRMGQFPQINTSTQGLTGIGAQATYFTLYRGRQALVLRPGTGGIGTGIYTKIDAMAMLPHVSTALEENDQSDTDDMSCWRCYAYLQFEPQPTYQVGATGIFWSAANVGSFGLDNGAGGFGFTQTDANTIEFIRRQVTNVGVITRQVVFFDPNGLTKWNCYEIRIIGSKAGRGQRLKAFINGVLVAEFDWTADGIGNPLHSNLEYYYATTLHARGAGGGGGNAGMGVNRVQMMTAPTEELLL